jgi:hypothetical protein
MFSSDFAADLREMHRQRLSRRLTQSILFVQALAHDTQRLRNALDRIAQEMQRLHLLNRELLLTDAKRKGGYFLIWLALVACCLVDFILLSAVAEYFASRVYSDPVMITLARIVIPLSIVTIEMLVSTQRAFAQQQQDDVGEKKTGKSWMIFMAGLLLFLPAMLVATHRNIAGKFDSSLADRQLNPAFGIGGVGPGSARGRALRWNTWRRSQSLSLPEAALVAVECARATFER